MLEGVPSNRVFRPVRRLNIKASAIVFGRGDFYKCQRHHYVRNEQLALIVLKEGLPGTIFLIKNSESLNSKVRCGYAGSQTVVVSSWLLQAIPINPDRASLRIFRHTKGHRILLTAWYSISR